MNNLRANALCRARIVDDISDLGGMNFEFTLRYLEHERMSCVGQSLGGNDARPVLFGPATGPRDTTNARLCGCRQARSDLV